MDALINNLRSVYKSLCKCYSNDEYISPYDLADLATIIINLEELYGSEVKDGQEIHNKTNREPGSSY